jgi:prepilin-type N-terminal cleavage/methylation domain-containing protein
MRIGRELRFRTHSSQEPRCGRLRLRARRLATANQSERGFTLVEILVVISLLSIVLAVLMGPMIDSQRIANRQFNYAAAQQSARTGLDSMVAQIRQATAIIASGPNFVEMNVNLQGVSYTVEYECDIAQPVTPDGEHLNECLRGSTSQGGTPSMSSGTAIVVSNLRNGTPSSPVFTWGPDPNAPYYMTATIQVPASNAKTGGLTRQIVFTDGALMRNLNVGN